MSGLLVNGLLQPFLIQLELMEWVSSEFAIGIQIVQVSGIRVRGYDLSPMSRKCGRHYSSEFLTDPWKIEMSPVGNQNQIRFRKSSVLQESSDRRSVLSESKQFERRIRRLGVPNSRRRSQVADRRRGKSHELENLRRNVNFRKWHLANPRRCQDLMTNLLP